MNAKFKLLPLVDMDGVLTEDERRRIIKRLHSMLSWVGSSVPEREIIQGKPIDLRKIVVELISKPRLTKEDLEKASVLAKGIAERERYLEEVIIHGDITEEEALQLLEEARGLLRAMEELRNIQERKKAIETKETLLNKVDDEKRWQHFIGKIKE
jgi:beta-phosphoglucomutase-like phosphatase (HAD superfamily)